MLNMGRRIDIYADATTAELLKTRFGYCFSTPVGSEYPPILNEHLIEPGQPLAIVGEGGLIAPLPFVQEHAKERTLGFRFGGLAYSCDVSGIPEESLSALSGLDVWILDALRYRPHPSHFSLEEALAWIARLKPRRAILTNLHTDLDYETLRKSLPESVEPGYDGLKIVL
jgi:phosphoribosyl 1,2-cyclic phosphate phosphodiesterase